MVSIVNHRDLAQARLATQFSESTNLINYVRSLLRESDDLETVFQDLLTKRFIDTAKEAQLDIIGIIVGQDREFKQSVANTYFGFKGTIGADTFGTVGDPNVGSNMLSVSDIEFADVVFDDVTYKIFIRSKISKNKTKLNIDDIIDIVLQGVTSSSSVTIAESQASFKLTFSGLLSDDDKLLLARTSFIPRPAGVSVSVADDDGSFT